MDITISELKKAATALSFTEYNTYLSSYPIILNWARKQKIDEEFLVIASHVVYGWMPRILSLRRRDEDVLSLLEEAKKGDFFLEEKKDNYKKLEKIITCVNGSLVGVSKLLHFINPEVYPIWDSNVYCYLFGKMPYDYQISKIENYKDYKNGLEDLIAYPEINEVTAEVNKKLMAYYELNPIDAEVELTVSKMRAIELTLFTKGRVIATKIKEEKKARKNKA